MEPHIPRGTGDAMVRFVVSACLAGQACRYDGGSTPCPEVIRLVERGYALPLCPEVLSGLPVPRRPCELRDGRVVCPDGTDVSAAFAAGARHALDMARAHGCTAAILKSRSPSCGFDRIYDGTFSGRLAQGDGVWAEALRQAGFTLYNEEHLPPLEEEC